MSKLRQSLVNPLMRAKLKMHRPFIRLLKRFSIGAGFAAYFLMFGLSGNQVDAKGVKAIKSFKDWSVHVIGKKNKRICYIHGVPKILSKIGKSKRRDATYIQVTHRIENKVRNEVSITAGYVYKKETEAKVNISGKNFLLFTDGGTAWAKDARNDSALVAAMRAGAKMVITGISSRGTVTKDHYSLAGFTAAHRGINKSCGIKK